MLKRIVSLMMCMVLIVGIIPICAKATDAVTVSVSFSINGTLEADKYGEIIANREIELSGKESYTANDALHALHTLYHPDGEEAYGTDVSTSDWGTYSYITKLWGDNSGKFGYQVNGGEVSTTLDTPMGDGDTLDVCIYENYYPDTEDYTKFDIRYAEVIEGESVYLTLSYCSGYDDNTFAMIFSPLEGATITIDGEKTDIVTDADGRAEITVEDAGNYIISAAMTKTLAGENPKVVGAITAPACTLKVTMRPENALLHGIAGAYLDDGVLDSGSNLPWIVADLAVYAELYPNGKNVFGKNLRQACLDKLISNAATMNSPGDLAKTIIALSALGYDASAVYTSSGAELKLVEKLIALVDAQSEDVTNMYTLPYVIIALGAGDYATHAQMEYLVNSAISTKADWLKVEDMGTDAMTPMILALAPYDAAKDAIDEAVTVLLGEQREDGLIDGLPGYESASTALAICALSALDYDVTEITKGGDSLMAGLISDANEDMTALSNAFATEQGFRALLAWKMQGEGVYDFSDFPKDEAHATRVAIGGGGGGGTTKPVVPEEEPEEIPEEVPAISFPDVKEGDWYYDAVSFVCNEGLFNGTGNGFEPNGKMTRAMLVTVLYRLGGEQTAEASAFDDVKAGDWYFDAVNWAASKGIVKGVNEYAFAPNESVTREQLATILYRFAASKGEDTEGSDISTFADADTVSSYAIDAISFAVARGIVTGKGEGILAPRDTATRAEVATMLMRYTSK